jgi:hypothetical protein
VIISGVDAPDGLAIPTPPADAEIVALDWKVNERVVIPMPLVPEVLMLLLLSKRIVGTFRSTPAVPFATIAEALNTSRVEPVDVEVTLNEVCPVQLPSPKLDAVLAVAATVFPSMTKLVLIVSALAVMLSLVSLAVLIVVVPRDAVG